MRTLKKQKWKQDFMMSAALIIRTKSYFCQCSTWVFFSPCMSEETWGVLQRKFSKARLSLTRQNLKTQPETIIGISVLCFFLTFCINLGFLLHHQHSCCCCPSSFCSIGHMSTLGFNKPLASAENCPHKTYCKYKIRYLKKMLFHIILNETEHNKLPTRSLW